jgi:hypothetical protein
MYTNIALVFSSLLFLVAAFIELLGNKNSEEATNYVIMSMLFSIICRYRLDNGIGLSPEENEEYKKHIKKDKRTSVEELYGRITKDDEKEK